VVLEGLLSSIHEMSAKNQKLKDANFSFKSFDFSKLDLSLSLHTMILSVHSYIGMAELGEPASSMLDRRFQLSSGIFRSYSTEDRKMAIDTIMNSVYKQRDKEYFFHSAFSSDFYQEKDRVRALTDGKAESIISKQREYHVFELYANSFNLILNHYFRLISSDEFLLNLLPLAFKILEDKGKFMPLSAIMRRFFTHLYNLSDRRIHAQWKKLSYEWYQENQIDFFHDSNYISFDTVNFFSFLLNKVQKTELFHQLQDDLLKTIEACQEKSKNQLSHDKQLEYDLRVLENRTLELLKLKNTLTGEHL